MTDRPKTTPIVADLAAGLRALRQDALESGAICESMIQRFGRIEFLTMRHVYEHTRRSLQRYGLDLLLGAIEEHRRAGASDDDCDRAALGIRMVASGATLTEFVECDDFDRWLNAKRSAEL
jgi:hypothetical protein